ncbi:response regulator transcription factor [Haploplasma axanthum]|uniref:Staphylococcal respiratory response protein A n=1 Tax=Haploplasma axanthum TaxID=29552 RepID=A0A449BFS5_HAPAX|nr:response regulator transcription factor [Haploplasma axanthum]VEU81304.1 Staphylococcal respiratory response protein A [Haploplasma axanthum]
MLIYFVEDDQSISYIIDKTLEKMGLERQGFQTGKEFLDAYAKKEPNLILLDIMLPDTSGLELLKKVRETNKELPIIIVSALFSEMDKVIALDAGADDYLTKPFGILELTSRIQAKLRKVSSNKIIKYHDVEIDTKKHKVIAAGEEIIFTNKEYEIFMYLIKKNDEVLSKEQIFLDVWRTSFMGETRALDMHVKAIRKKLADVNSKVVIETVYGVGYKLGVE